MQAAPSQPSPAVASPTIVRTHIRALSRRRYCRDAHRNLEQLRYGGLAAGTAALVWLPTPEERAVAVTAAAALVATLNFVIGLFRRYEFSHAEND